MAINQYNSVCPHDCPSTCALLVEIETKENVARMGREGVGEKKLWREGAGRKKLRRVRGDGDHPYTAGVICAKVARYAERLNHPERLLNPLYRKNKTDEFKSISWDSALDIIGEQFIKSEKKYGAESVWPYLYAGTMGLVQRDSIERLRRAKAYSEQHDTICVNNAWTGFSAATGSLRGPNPCEMAKSDCIVIWGTNAVATQVNVMTHAIKARKKRGAKIIVIDIYENDTTKQADMALILNAGTDAALACAVAHILFRDNYVDWQYVNKYTDCPQEFEKHLQDKTPEWASKITSLSVDEIESFARLVGSIKKTYYRLGYGFTRTRNGAVAMHAACCLPTLTGAWQHEGGGAFHCNSDIFKLNKKLLVGEEFPNPNPNVRHLDQSRIGAILCGEKKDLYNGVPISSMLIQNTNPVSVVPEQTKVKQGFARGDLFIATHEQFLTETAELSNIVLPATMFLEHDDIYRGSGHFSLLYGGKLLESPPNCRSNLFVIEELAKRLGVAHLQGFGLSANEHIDMMLQTSQLGTLAELKEKKWIDFQPNFTKAHYLDGFSHESGKFHFKADWQNVKWGRPAMGLKGSVKSMPSFPDHWQVIEGADKKYPLRLATPPARSFLNSTFNETKTSQQKEGGPKVFIHKKTASKYKIKDGAKVRLKNSRGSVILQSQYMQGIKENVLICEGIHPNSCYENGCGINTLVGADSTAPHGGVAFHDIKVAIESV